MAGDRIYWRICVVLGKFSQGKGSVGISWGTVFIILRIGTFNTIDLVGYLEVLTKF